MHLVDHAERRRLHGQQHVRVAHQSVAISREGDIAVRRIRERDGIAGAGLHVQLRPELHQPRDDGWNQRNAPFVRLCFLQNGDVDKHARPR